MENPPKEEEAAPSVPDPIRTVAIIGAGLSGIVAAAHLLGAGLAVTVFERGDVIGGVWVYSAQPDAEPPFPNTRPADAPERAGSLDEKEKDEEEEEEEEKEVLEETAAARAFAPPGPTFTRMRSRGSEKTMRTSLGNWPVGTAAPIAHADVVAHLRDLADVHGVLERVRFRTRVDAVVARRPDPAGPNGGGGGGGRGRGRRWRIQTSRLVVGTTAPTTTTTTPVEGRRFAREEREPPQDFDAVVVAAGRYHTPRVPDIPGLARWKTRVPGRVRHTKQYRTPEPYRGKTVLLIGASISALEVANELVASGGGGGATKVYLSARPSGLDCRDAVSGGEDETTEKVAMVAEFGAFADDKAGGDGVPLGPWEDADDGDDDDRPIPAQVVLQGGRVLEGIHHVLFGTGYLANFPFLGPALQQPHTAPEDADETVVVTADGKMLHNLHEDIFYIPDPSLAFVGVTHFASEFSIQDLKAQVLAAVWAGRVRLPAPAAMRAEQARRKRHLRGPGPFARALNGIYLLDDFVIRRLLEWANRHLVEGGFDPISGPDAEWWTAFRAESEKARSAMGPLQDGYLQSYGVSWDLLPSLLPYAGKT